jgi:hypothetical protein
MCASLDAVAGDVVAVAAALEARARSLGAAATQIRSMGLGTEDQHRLTRLAEQFNAAGLACQGAAINLRQAHHTATSYTRSIYGGGGGGGGEGGGGGGLGSANEHSTGAPDLSDRLSNIYFANSFPTAKGDGRFFLAPGDKFLRVADTMPAAPAGTYLAMVHGSSDSVSVGGQALTPHEMAALIRADPNYQEGQNVTLFSCSTGSSSSGFAQQLADELKVRVLAPTNLAWLPPESDGIPIVSPRDESNRPLRRPDGSGYGRWVWFSPGAGSGT